tara:strand:+ start:2462 stop:2923 length:462 start_codon:yes stop_codon:yes gene_type:complete
MKKLLLFTGIALGGIYYFGQQKLIDIKSIVQQLQFKLLKMYDVKIESSAVKFKVDLSITNPTQQNLAADANGFVTLSKLKYYNLQEEMIGQSNVDVQKIMIAAGETIRFESLETSIPISNVGGAINTILNRFKNPDNIIVKAELTTPAGVYII